MKIKGFVRANSGRFCSSLNDFLIQTIIFFQKARMPKKQAKRKLLKYDHEKMIQAVEAVKSGAIPIRVAATKYGVPKSTLGDKMSGRSDLDTNIGRRAALSEAVENKIVDTVLEASKRGMGISRRQLFARTSANK